jgi:O-antigen/teichoic acid export membrane protein
MPRPSIWRGAWVAYTSGCSLNFVAGFWLALLSGINRVRLAQQIQLSASIVNQIVSLAGVLAGLSAWALVIGNIAMGVTVFIAARTSVRACTGLRSIPASAADWSLVGVLWPNAWRMALVSVGGYCLTYANTLVCSSMIDLSHTASYGLSLQLIGMTAALSGAWVQVILPSLSARRVDSDGTTIAGKFAKRIRLFFLTYAAGGVLVVTAGPWMLNAVGAMTPLLPRLQLALMALYVFLEVHHTLYGALVLTENRNPFVVLALVSGACSIALSIMLTPRFGVWGLLVAPGIVQALCSNWWVVLRGIRGLGIPVRQYVRIVMALDRK